MRLRRTVDLFIVAVMAAACSSVPAAAADAKAELSAGGAAAASVRTTSPTPSFRPGPNSVSGTVVRQTATGIVLRSLDQEIEVDVSSVTDVWKETSVAASAIDIGDEVWVNGTQGLTAFVARYIWVNIGRIDGVVISFNGREMALGMLRGERPVEMRVELSAYVEIVRLGRSGQALGDRWDLTPGRQVGMVTYHPHEGLPRATRIWWDEPTTGPTPSPRGSVLRRPSFGLGRSVIPLSLGASAAAGSIVIRSGQAWWWDEGPTGVVTPFPASEGETEHPSPAGGLIAVEHLTATTPGGAYLIATELAVREQGVERLVYRAPGVGFYWASWSPDGRYVAVWEIEMFSGSIDMDGRPLVVIDVRTGARTELGRTLLSGTTAWTAPHTLAYVAGGSRMVWETKTLRLWSPETGIRDLTGPAVAAFAPAWSADGRSLYFVSGPAGQWDPLQAVAGRGVGDRHLNVWDAGSGTIRLLAHEPGYVEEGVRPSRDGAHLLVLRRKTAAATDLRAIPDVDLEVWLTAPDGSGGMRLIRFPALGLNAYGYLSGPSEWAWTE
jgi:hypothetical protein